MYFYNCNTTSFYIDLKIKLSCFIALFIFLGNPCVNAQIDCNEAKCEAFGVIDREDVRNLIPCGIDESSDLMTQYNNNCLVNLDWVDLDINDYTDFCNQTGIQICLDVQEILQNGNPFPSEILSLDCDGDGYSNYQECTYSSSVCIPATDSQPGICYCGPGATDPTDPSSIPFEAPNNQVDCEPGTASLYYENFGFNDDDDGSNDSMCQDGFGFPNDDGCWVLSNPQDNDELVDYDFSRDRMRTDYIPVASSDQIFTFSFMAMSPCLNQNASPGVLLAIRSVEGTFETQYISIPAGEGWVEISHSFVIPAHVTSVQFTLINRMDQYEVDESSGVFQQYDCEFDLNQYPGLECDSGDCWPIFIDNLFLGEGISATVCSGSKEPVDNGGNKKIDEFGNVTIDGEAFFPFMIYGSKVRLINSGASTYNPSIYTDMGFNTWAWGSYAESGGSFIPAVESEMFANIDLGLFANETFSKNGFTISEMMNDVNQNYGDDLLFYYLDNEYKAANPFYPEILRQVKEQPTYGAESIVFALNGNPGLASQYDEVDITGSYISGDKLQSLNVMSLNTNPVTIGQINICNERHIKPYVYTAIIEGAKGIGYFGDFLGSNNPSKCSSGNQDITEAVWYNDFCSITHEVKNMMHVVRMPHWTTWDVKLLEGTEYIEIGTRETLRQGSRAAYILVANKDKSDSNILLDVSELQMESAQVINFHTGQLIGQIQNGELSLSIEAEDGLLLEVQGEIPATVEFMDCDLPLSNIPVFEKVSCSADFTGGNFNQRSKYENISTMNNSSTSPNPFTDLLMINTKEALGKVNILVVNIFGQVVYEVNNVEANQHMIKTHDWVSGSYIAKVAYTNADLRNKHSFKPMSVIKVK